MPLTRQRLVLASKRFSDRRSMVLLVKEYDTLGAGLWHGDTRHHESDVG